MIAYFRFVQSMWGRSLLRLARLRFGPGQWYSVARITPNNGRCLQGLKHFVTLSNLWTNILQSFVGNVRSIVHDDVTWWFQLEKETCLNHVSPRVLLFIPQDHFERNNAVPELQEGSHSSNLQNSQPRRDMSHFAFGFWEPSCTFDSCERSGSQTQFSVQSYGPLRPAAQVLTSGNTDRFVARNWVLQSRNSHRIQ